MTRAGTREVYERCDHLHAVAEGYLAMVRAGDHSDFTAAMLFTGLAMQARALRKIGDDK